MKFSCHIETAGSWVSAAIAKVMSQLFKLKYAMAETKRAGRITLSVVEACTSGGMCAVRKNSSPAHHAETAGAAMLKSARYDSGRRFAIQSEITKPSNATVSVPAAGPYRRIAVKTKASEIEIDAGTDGSFTVADPLISVSAASRN